MEMKPNFNYNMFYLIITQTYSKPTLYRYLRTCQNLTKLLSFQFYVSNKRQFMFWKSVSSRYSQST